MGKPSANVPNQGRFRRSSGLGECRNATPVRPLVSQWQPCHDGQPAPPASQPGWGCRVRGPLCERIDQLTSLDGRRAAPEGGGVWSLGAMVEEDAQRSAVELPMFKALRGLAPLPRINDHDATSLAKPSPFSFFDVELDFHMQNRAAAPEARLRQIRCFTLANTVRPFDDQNATRSRLRGWGHGANRAGCRK